MNLDLIILIVFSFIAIFSLLFIPKKKWFQAQFIFLFVQFPTWVIGLAVVELKLLEYPYRELSKVNRTSFIFEYLILPILCIHFNVHYPSNEGKLKKISYYIITALVLTSCEFLLEKYTQLIKYTGWEWYWTFIGVLFVLWLSRITTLWFFGKVKS